MNAKSIPISNTIITIFIPLIAANNFLQANTISQYMTISLTEPKILFDYLFRFLIIMVAPYNIHGFLDWATSRANFPTLDLFTLLHAVYIGSLLRTSRAYLILLNRFPSRLLWNKQRCPKETLINSNISS